MEKSFENFLNVARETGVAISLLDIESSEKLHASFQEAFIKYGYLTTYIDGLTSEKLFVDLNDGARHISDVEWDNLIDFISTYLAKVNCFVFFDESDCKEVLELQDASKLANFLDRLYGYNLYIFSPEGGFAIVLSKLNHLIGMGDAMGWIDESW